MAGLPRWAPRGIAGQIVCLVLGGVLVLYLGLSAAITLARQAGLAGGAELENSAPAMTDRFAEFVQVLDRLPAPLRPEVAAAMHDAYPAIDLTLAPPRPEAPPAPAGGAGLGDKFDHLRRVLGPGLIPAPLSLAAADHGKRRWLVEVTLRDGTRVVGAVPGVGPPPETFWPTLFLAGSLASVGLILVALLWWATRGLTAPLARLASSAESFSLDRNPASLPEEGPGEVRAAARALNRMQGRIRGMVEDRTRMLAAIGHDLRTPITRMRLRAEFIDDEALRRPLLRDLDQMHAMVQSALSYLRDGEVQGRATLVDLAPLLQTICHEFADMGEDVAFLGLDHLLVRASPEELTRAVTNLVENAVKYGGRATVRLAPASPSTVSIEVEDEGPGIPADQTARMLEPFVRGDEARTSQAGAGFGLGLSIARAVAEGHGGGLTLVNRHPAGLTARLDLPLERGRTGAAHPAPAEG